MSTVGTIKDTNIVEVMIANTKNWTSVMQYGECILKLKQRDFEAKGTGGHVGMNGCGTYAKRNRNLYKRNSVNA